MRKKYLAALIELDENEKQSVLSSDDICKPGVSTAVVSLEVDPVDFLKHLSKLMKPYK